MPQPEKPLASQALLDYLDQCYPFLTAHKYMQMTEREVAHYMGQRFVIEKLWADVNFYNQKEE